VARLLFKNKLFTSVLPIVSLSVFLGAFYYFTAPMIWLDIRNAREADLLWLDEGLHLRSIERMQSQHTWELLHHAYTAFYSHISYLVSCFFNGFEDPISTGGFITGSRWASYLSIQVLILTVFWRLSSLMESWKWAFLGMCFVGMQRGSYYFAITMHPEPPMLLGIVIAIFSATEYMRRPRFLLLSCMALGIALAIASKLQALLLLPWAGIIFLIGLWIGRIKALRTIFLWMIGSLTTLVSGVILFTPYQVFHWQRLWQGIQSERKVQTYTEINIFDWIEYTASNELVGYSYSVLLLFSFYSFSKRFYKNRNNMREWLSKPIPALFVANLIWVMLGTGYVFVGVEVLIARYLIHVAPSLMLLAFVGVYWLSVTPSTKRQFTGIILLIIIVGAGLQQQTKHASFDFRVRKEIADRLVYIRKAMAELKIIVPQDSHILTPRGLLMDSQWFTNTHQVNPIMQIIEQSKIEYLLIHEGYLASLNREGVSLEDSRTESVYRDEIKFMSALTLDGVGEEFQVLREYSKARLTLYHRKYQN
jgi:hypothetical protein